MITPDNHADAKPSASRSDQIPTSEIIAASQAALAALATLAEDMRQSAHRWPFTQTPKPEKTDAQRDRADTRDEQDSLAA